MQGDPQEAAHLQECKAGDRYIYPRQHYGLFFFDKTDYYISPKFFYDQVADIQPFVLGAYAWEGYTCTSFGYPYTMLEARHDGCVFQVMILMKNGEHEISPDDADVKTILESITPINREEL